MKTCELILENFNLLTFDASIDDEWGLVRGGAVVVADGEILWVGAVEDLPEFENRETVNGGGSFLSPSLIDCHTHLVWGGSRADEWQMRLAGTSYEEIARSGGGILSTVKATRAASEDELFQLAKRRVENFIAQGVTTVEIKSGYALNVEGEIKMLRVAKRLGESLPIDVEITLLGAHALPPEFKGKANDYIGLVVDEMIPAAVGLASAVDVFTENIAFDLKQTERVFSAAKNAGLAIKIHAEQLSNMGGAKLAAESEALSADHLEYLDEPGVEAMSAFGTVATLLPGAFYFLNETQKPPIELLRKHGVPIAIASDANPGSSPVASILLMANMACTFFGMTPCESLRGLTINAARALSCQDSQGSLEVGKQADFAIWDVDSPAELAFAIGHNPCQAVYKAGKKVFSRDQGWMS